METTAGPRRPATRRVNLRLPDQIGNVAWNLLGLFGSAAAQWGIIAMLARYGSPTMVGQYAFGLATTAPVILLASLGLRVVLVTDTSGRFAFREYLRLRTAAMAVAVAAIGVVAVTRGSGDGTVIMLIGVAKAIDGVGDIYCGRFQQLLRMRLVATSMIINNVATLLIMAVLLRLTRDIGWTTAGSVAGSTLGSLVYCRYAAGRAGSMAPSGATRPIWKAIKRGGTLVRIALPVGLASGLNSFSGNVPRYLLEHRLGTGALGVFAVVAYATVVTNIFFAGVAQTALPKMSELYSGGAYRALSTLTARLVLGSLALGAVAVAAALFGGNAALRLVYGSAYAQQGHLLAILAASVGFSGALFFLNGAISATRKFGRQLAVSLAMLVFNVAISLILISTQGLAGAAWALVASLGCEALLKLMVFRHALAVPAELSATARHRASPSRYR
ncbi:lipopolysaccharide biosynthesis protein [Micromonospora sp. C28ISP2-4]|nr:oligosaccharide flippase family protein [Micromonospora sp. C28ISP2-4]MDO3685124.1 oligosaccharide flippase family protein [Micromonospora sp. C28ISP2-4]